MLGMCFTNLQLIIPKAVSSFLQCTIPHFNSFYRCVILFTDVAHVTDGSSSFSLQYTHTVKQTGTVIEITQGVTRNRLLNVLVSSLK